MMNTIINLFTKKSDKGVHYFLTSAPSSEKTKVFRKAIQSAKEQQNDVIKQYELMVNSGTVSPIKQRQRTSAA